MIFQRWFRSSPALIGLLFANAFLVLLVAGAVQELSRPLPRGHAYAFIAGIATFIAVYEWFWLRGIKKEGRAQTLVPLAGLVALGVTITLAFPGWLPVMIYAATVAGMGFDFRWQPALAAIAAVTAVAAAVDLLLYAAGGHADDPVIVFQTALSGIALLAIGQLVGTNIELKRARETIADLAVNEERLRFARDLHDLLGHSLSLIVLKAELAARLADSPDRVRSEVHDIERVARDALQEVRETVVGYRQPTLGQELENAREVLKASGIEWRCDHTSGPLPAAVEAVLAWAVRESITNVVRHSNARRCTISIVREEGWARTTVEDNGGGCETVVLGSGLRGLSERSAFVGGSAEAAPMGGGGFRVQVTLPIEQPVHKLASA